MCSVKKVFFEISHFRRRRAATLLKKETQTQLFSCEVGEISKHTFFTEHLWATASGRIN